MQNTSHAFRARIIEQLDSQLQPSLRYRFEAFLPTRSSLSLLRPQAVPDPTTLGACAPRVRFTCRGVALSGPSSETQTPGVIPPRYTADVILPLQPKKPTLTDPVIVVGSSTGGTEALRWFLTQFPADSPPILIAQHMPANFIASFVSRLREICPMQVKEAEHGDPARRGWIYISPGHSHLMLGLSGDRHYLCKLAHQAEPVNRHRPSVDVLFRSAANLLGQYGIGVILTGMGNDGAAGMLEMRRAGCYNFAQDEATSVVYGMPKEAFLLGGVHEICPLNQLSVRVRHYLANDFPRHPDPRKYPTAQAALSPPKPGSAEASGLLPSRRSRAMPTAPAGINPPANPLPILAPKLKGFPKT